MERLWLLAEAYALVRTFWPQLLCLSDWQYSACLQGLLRGGNAARVLEALLLCASAKLQHISWGSTPLSSPTQLYPRTRGALLKHMELQRDRCLPVLLPCPLPCYPSHVLLGSPQGSLWKRISQDPKNIHSDLFIFDLPEDYPENLVIEVSGCQPPYIVAWMSHIALDGLAWLPCAAFQECSIEQAR